MTPAERLVELDRTSPKRVAVVGDAMLDVYIHGYLAESQDGCEKFVQQDVVTCAGGAANAANTLSNWKSECRCFSNKFQRGPEKTRFLVDGRIVFRHDFDRMSVSEAERAQEALVMQRWEPDAVLVSDYDKGFLTESMLTIVQAYAAWKGVPCVVDAKREPRVYSSPFVVLKGNLDYFARRAVPCEQFAGTVCTRGDSTPIVDGCAVWQRSMPVTCVNHVGAGDCFAAHLALALAHGLRIDDAAAVAHSAGRVYVQFPHNCPPDPQDVLADYQLLN